MAGENQSSEVRRSAAAALGKLGEHAASAVPALTQCLADKIEFVRRGGWGALGRSQAGAQLRDSQLKHGPGMRQLQSIARDAGCTDAWLEVAGVVGENQSSEVRCSAASILGNLGEHAAPAVPALTKCLADKDCYVRRGVS